MLQCVELMTMMIIYCLLNFPLKSQGNWSFMLITASGQFPYLPRYCPPEKSGLAYWYDSEWYVIVRERRGVLALRNKGCDCPYATTLPFLSRFQ
jgi:hypothetical protein